jgi:Na+/proline symporter
MAVILFNFVLYEMGLNLGWVYNFMGTVIGSAVPPVACLLLTEKLPALGAILSAWVGMVVAVIAWLVHSSTLGPIDLVTTGDLDSQLWGSSTALVVSSLICGEARELTLSLTPNPNPNP